MDIIAFYITELRTTGIVENKDGLPLEYAMWLLCEMITIRDDAEKVRYLGLVQGILIGIGRFHHDQIHVHNKLYSKKVESE